MPLVNVAVKTDTESHTRSLSQKIEKIYQLQYAFYKITLFTK